MRARHLTKHPSSIRRHYRRVGVRAYKELKHMDELSEGFVEGSAVASRAIVFESSLDTTFVCLNFKVPLSVRQRFKIYAARNNMTMTELLMRLLDDCLSADNPQG